MSQQVKFTLDKGTIDVMERVPPELRNAAIIVAVKMFSKSSIYKKYFCEDCVQMEDEEVYDVDLPVSNSNEPNAYTSTATPENQPVVNWDTF